MKQKLCMFVIHQTATNLQQTNNLNPRTIRYPVLDESNWMKSAYFTIYPGKNPPPQNGCRFFFLKHRCHILHFPNSTGLFTKPTDRHYTKYRFSPDIALHSRFTMSWQPKLLDFERMCIFCKKSLPQIWALMSAQNSLATKHNLQILSTLAFAGLQQSGSRGDSIDRQRIGMRLLQRLPMGFRLKMHTCHLLLDLLVDLLRHSVGHLSRRPLPMGGSCQHGWRSSGADLWSGRTGDT